MNVGIIGIGIVGRAIYNVFKQKNINVIAYDKYKNIGNLNDIMLTDILFICLPTPYNEQLKEYDLTELDYVLNNLNNVYNGLVVIKSTLLPNTIDNLTTKYTIDLIHNPEFLSSKTAEYDFENQTHIVLGIPSIIISPTLYETKVSILINFYKQYFADSKISVCFAKESEAMKIFLNSFYATKIMFFNELYSLCNKTGIDYNNVKTLMLKNEWIHPMHTTVPGLDGQCGFGGVCFPKDTQALNEYMIKYKSPNTILSSVINENILLRFI